MINFENMGDAQTLALAIVNTIPEPFLVLDGQFRVLAASRSFYETFKADPERTRGCLLYALGDGQWDIPALRVLLETIIPQHLTMDGFAVEHDFPNLGPRCMLLNARIVLHEDRSRATILLAFTDVTVRRAIEREKDELLLQTEMLLRQKDILLREMQHRVANSLQIIASILLIKARAVTSDDTRHELEDAHRRVLSVAAVQQHLNAAAGIDQIDVVSYLSTLCDSLASSMIGESQPILLKVVADAGRIDSSKAISLGLIVTELVINAIKYAFPAKKSDALVLVTYERFGPDWKLMVSDNGVGKNPGESVRSNAGLGTAIVNSLARQLDAQMEVVSSRSGMSVSVSSANITSHLPRGG